MTFTRVEEQIQRGVARSALVACLVVFSAAFATRVFLLSKIPDEYIRPHTRFEESAVAMSLYETGAFANPYLIPTGPTGHTPPLYPAWISLLYRVFGTSLKAGYVKWSFDLAFDSAMFAMLPWLAYRFGLGWPSGLLGGLAGAMTPRWVSTSEALAAIALAALLNTFIARWSRHSATTRASWLLGIGSGVAFHVQPALLPVVLGCLAFELWWMRQRRHRLGVLVVALGMAMALAPWTWRNWVTFGELYFIRSNLGLELRIGNHDGAHADVEVSDERHRLAHPRTVLQEAELVRDVGEAEYMRRAKADALRWIRDHPSEYAKLVATRIVYFWIGPVYRPVEGPLHLLLFVLAAFGVLKCGRALPVPQRAAVIVTLLAFPVVYYVVSWMPRYRIPMEWILFLFAGAGITSVARVRDRNIPA